MNIMQTYPIDLPGGSGKHYLLLNENGRLSDCVCCCPIDRRLYLHMVPVFGDPNCLLVDQGPGIGAFVFGLFEPGIQNCDTRDTDVLNTVDPGDEGFGMQCWNGPPFPGGESGQVYELGVGATLTCNPVNQWRLDLCLKTQNHPDYPDTIDEEYSQCDELFLGIPPMFENTCDAEPGEFLLDYGNIYPFAGEDGPYEQYLSEERRWSGDPCLCQFHLYIDESLDGTLEDVNNLYWYPAESAAGMWRAGLPDMIWFYETMPSIGTPLHPARRPTTAVPERRVPDELPADIAQALEDL